MLQLLCLFDYCQNETVTFRSRYVFHWWFHLCYKHWDTWNGFVCLETSTSEGFWKLLQSFSFTYATINEDIYATLCVDIIRRRNHVHMLYVQCCYTWYFKNLFLLGLGFLHGSKKLKKDDWRYYKIRIGNQSWQVWVYLLSRYKYQNFLVTNIDCNRDVGVRTALTMMKNW